MTKKLAKNGRYEKQCIENTHHTIQANDYLALMDFILEIATSGIFSAP